MFCPKKTFDASFQCTHMGILLDLGYLAAFYLQVCVLYLGLVFSTKSFLETQFGPMFRLSCSSSIRRSPQSTKTRTGTGLSALRYVVTTLEIKSLNTRVTNDLEKATSVAVIQPAKLPAPGPTPLAHGITFASVDNPQRPAPHPPYIPSECYGCGSLR